MTIQKKKRLPVITLAVVFSFFSSILVFAEGAVFAPNGPNYIPVGGDNAATANYLNNVANGGNGTSTNPSTTPGAAPINVNIPTPDSLGNPLKSSTQTNTSTGQYRNADNSIKLSKMLLNRFKDAVVRVRALDADGNELGRAMGFGVGRPPEQYIVTPLSLLLGNNQQWAERIEITHDYGNQYSAKIALVDEELNIVLLKPEVNPIQISMVKPEDQRPQIEIFTIAFDDGEDGKIIPNIYRSTLAAVNNEEGTLSIASKNSEEDESAAGTAILNTQGELVGMLLPNQRGILSSMIQTLMTKIHELLPIEPQMLGVIMGRGIMVDPHTDGKIDGVYPSISGAFSALQKREAPKINSTRFIQAKTNKFRPKASDKVIVKVLPGSYREKGTILLPSNISLVGSGSKQTLILGTNPNQPVLAASRASNINISSLRVVPSPLQQQQNAAIFIDNSSNITMLGNIFEAKGGTAVRARSSQNIIVIGNTFPASKNTAIDCQDSATALESNAFLGDWEVAISIGKDCRATIKRNLFMQNKVSITTTGQASRLNVESNSFIKSVAGIRTSSNGNVLNVNDNLFFENYYALYSSSEIPARAMGRNAAWRSRFQVKGHQIQSIDVVRTEPEFENPGAYDFRIKLGRGQLGAAAQQSGADLGAFQRTDYLGPFTAQLLHSLESATGRNDLASVWGYQE